MTPRLLRLALMLTAAAIPFVARAAQQGYDVTPTPDWVSRIATPDTTSPASGGAPSEILLWDEEVRLGDTPVRYQRTVEHALTAVGLQQTSEIRIGFNPAFQKLHLHHIVILHNGAAHEVTDNVHPRLLQREESLDDGIQDGMITAVFTLEDVDVGDTVDVSYSIEGQNPIFGQRNFGFLGSNSNRPIHQLSMRIIARPGQPLTIRPHNTALKMTSLTDRGVTQYQASATDVPAVVEESDTPPWLTGYGWIEYSEYANWGDVATWGAALYKVPDGGSKDLFEKAYQRISQASPTPEAFIMNALQFTQQFIRYVGLEFGENSHRPNPPDVVLSRHFGDCKDKALLLTSLLRRYGINAYPALVSTSMRDGLASELASPGLFDHVITLAELGQQRYWLDGTRLYQAGGPDSIGTEDFGYALVIRGDTSGLTRMYPAAAPRLSSEVEENYYITDFRKPVRLTITSRFHGNTAESQRYRFSNMPNQEIQRQYLDFYRNFHDDIKATKPLSYSDDRKNNIVTIQEEYEIGNYWKISKGKFSGRVAITAFSGALVTPRTITRTTPMLLSRPRYITNRTFFHFPTNLNLVFDKKPVVISAPGVRYAFIDRYYDETYYHQSELTILAPYIMASDVPEFASKLHDIENAWDFSINFDDPETTGFPEVRRLKERLSAGS